VTAAVAPVCSPAHQLLAGPNSSAVVQLPAATLPESPPVSCRTTPAPFVSPRRRSSAARSVPLSRTAHPARHTLPVSAHQAGAAHSAARSSLPSALPWTRSCRSRTPDSRRLPPLPAQSFLPRSPPDAPLPTPAPPPCPPPVPPTLAHSPPVARPLV